MGSLVAILVGKLVLLVQRSLVGDLKLKYCYRLSASSLGALFGAEHVSLHGVEIVLPVLGQTSAKREIGVSPEIILLEHFLNWASLIKNKHQVYVYSYV